MNHLKLHNFQYEKKSVKGVWRKQQNTMDYYDEYAFVSFHGNLPDMCTHDNR